MTAGSAFIRQLARGLVVAVALAFALILAIGGADIALGYAGDISALVVGIGLSIGGVLCVGGVVGYVREIVGGEDGLRGEMDGV